MDGLVPISEGKYDRYEMAPIFALHNLINGEDGVSVEGLNGHICNYDFAESFSNSSLEMFIAASVIDPSILTSNIEQLLRSFSAALDFADFKYPNYTENHGLDPVKFRELALSAAYKLLEIEDEELVCMGNRR